MDQVDFTFFHSIGQVIGTETILPPLWSSSGNLATDVALVSPLNTRQVVAFLAGMNGQVDFKNIGFTANVSDPDLDPDVVPLPAAGWMLLAGLGMLMSVRKSKRDNPI